MTTVQSPLPGIFYRKPSPDAEPYAKEGTRISVGDTIGLVEVMKSFHEVKAETAGVVVRFLVENEAPVEIGQEILEIAE